jgi:arylsulfatase A-like enzyme
MTFRPWYLLALALMACTDPLQPPVREAPPPLTATYTGTAPNVVLILSDDQRQDLMLAHMPLSRRRLADSGVTFTAMIANSALCCPVRASLFTGQYVHTHGVLTNAFATGGGARMFADAQTLATELRARGVLTALIGKYLNENKATSFPSWPYVPPGWDEWRAFTPEPRYWGYTLVEKAFDDTAKRLISYGGAATQSAYSTTVLAKQALRFIARAPSDKPIFLVFAPFAPHVDWPHVPPLVPSVDATACPGPWSHLPSVNEADVTDKPQLVRTAPLLSAGDLDAELRMKREMCKAMQSVDRGIRDIVNALATTNRLANTYLFFLSDQGFQLGEHRLRNRKQTIYEEVVRGSLVVRGPGVPARLDTNLVQTIDIPATIRDVLGVGSFGPGRSLRSLLSGPGAPLHTEVLIENYVPNRPDQESFAVRSLRYKYAEYPRGSASGSLFRELYDLQVDRFELDNLLVTAPTDPTVLAVSAAMASRLAVLRVAQ